MSEINKWVTRGTSPSDCRVKSIGPEKYNFRISTWIAGQFFKYYCTMNEEDATTHRVAFKMKLYEGQEAEYKRRHSELWPELKQLLKENGISDYSIFLDEGTGILIGILKIRDIKALDNLPRHPVMQKWWAYMKEIMESHDDNSPVSIPLTEVFYLP